MIFNKNIFRFFVFLIVLGSISCSKLNANKDFSAIHFEEGDIIFRRGIGIKSHAVVHVDSTGLYSHAGIIVLQNSVFSVIHITPGERKKGENADRIKIEPLEDFWRKDRATNGAVYRFKNNFSGDKAARQAKRLLEKGVLFDHDYDLSDSTRMYCTELVWYVYQLEGKDITCGKRSEINMPLYSGTYILPSDIYNNKDVLLIYNY